MLDQNTDRMWYVIGAVIVGAALIFLMNGAFPTLFANVGTTFEEKVGDTTEMTDGIGPARPNANLIPASAQTELWDANGKPNSEGLSFKDGWTRLELPTTATEYGTNTYIDVEPNTEYTQSITVRTDAVGFEHLRVSFFWPFEIGMIPGDTGHNRVETSVTKMGEDLYRVVGTGFTKPGQTRMRVPDLFAQFEGGTYAEFGQFKLEEGPIATPYVK